jgi:hypothetical protein
MAMNGKGVISHAYAITSLNFIYRKPQTENRKLTSLQIILEELLTGGLRGFSL